MVRVVGGESSTLGSEDKVVVRDSKVLAITKRDLTVSLKGTVEPVLVGRVDLGGVVSSKGNTRVLDGGAGADGDKAKGDANFRSSGDERSNGGEESSGGELHFDNVYI